MSGILKALGLGLVIATGVWLFTLWQWQNEAHDVTVKDIVWHLLLVPVLLTLVVLALISGVRQVRARLDAPAAPTEVPVAVGDANALDAEAQRLRQAWAWLVSADVHSNLGESTDQAWAALQAGQCRPALDEALIDYEGLPIFTGRVPDLDVETWRAEQWAVPEEEAPWATPAVCRALALLEGPWQRTLEAFDTLGVPRSEQDPDMPLWDEVEAEAAPHPAYLTGVAKPVTSAEIRQASQARPSLHIHVAWPRHWDERQRQQAMKWLQMRSQVMQEWASRVEALPPQWHVFDGEDVDLWLAQWDVQLRDWGRDPRPGLVLYVAVDTAVDEDLIQTWQEHGLLFTASHQAGLMPGEGSAVLMLAHAHWPHVLAQWPEAVRLGRPLIAQRAKSADAAARTGAKELQALLQEWSLGQAAEAVPPAHVLCDADHRSSRATELYEALQEAAFELDPATQVHRVGEACGDLGAARVLTVTALASAAARQCEGPGVTVLATHVHAPKTRVVVPVMAAQQTNEANALA